MAEARRGLGKGLGALIPTEAAPPAPTDKKKASSSTTTVAPVEGAVYVEVAPTDVIPNPRQPRQVFDTDALAELVHSIREVGLLQPIVVRRRPDAKKKEAHYELVAGERRWRACQEVGMERIPAIVRDAADDEMLRDALLENLHRAQLNPLEEAAAYQQLLADFGGTQEELAQRLGRSRPQVANTLRLLKLPPAVQRRVAAGVISAGHARALLSLEDPAAMDALADRVVQEGLSVRTVEEIVLIGDDGERKKRTPRPRGGAAPEVVAATTEIAERLGDALDTRVRVEGVRTARSHGRLVIEFADLEDLHRIADAIDE
ncbi:MAG: chromosome partitioning protein ParB [Actinomycetales bacterium mxb001]|nr:MAG: chromosome partitioning protein ParB [Actinomycetales bacterium mxb001]